jgi:hypothetical protein
MKKGISKNKYVLSADLVSVEPEPTFFIENEETENIQSRKNSIKEPQEQLSLKISAKIKREFQVWCVKNSKTMKEALEECLDEYVKKNTIN